jgi:hypothetical protein
MRNAVHYAIVWKLYVSMDWKFVEYDTLCIQQIRGELDHDNDLSNWESKNSNSHIFWKRREAWTTS